MDSITQDMKYRYSLMKYAEKYGVSRASRKYDKSRSYIYFGENDLTAPLNRWPAGHEDPIAIRISTRRKR